MTDETTNVNVIPTSIVAILLTSLVAILAGVYFFTTNATSDYKAFLSQSEKNLTDKITNAHDKTDNEIKSLKIDLADIKNKMATKDDIKEIEIKLNKLLAGKK